MLMRFVERSELLGITLSLQYLESTLESRKVQEIKLADTADAGLLFAVLFPERAKRLNVSSSYFRTMSRTCFLGLADLCESMKHKGESLLYREIAQSIEQLAYVLYCTRHKNTPIKELFQTTGREILH